jgi:hypothetical protein
MTAIGTNLNTFKDEFNTKLNEVKTIKDELTALKQIVENQAIAQAAII